MSTTHPPGWYRAPSAPHLERWWDGTAWTEHRRAPESFGPPADMDRITRGIRPVGDADTGGGVGSSIGPSER